MLDVKIDLVPFGDESMRNEIIHIVITNDGTGNPEIGNYNVEISKPFAHSHKFTIKSYDRSRGILALIGEIGKAVKEEE